MYNQNVLLYITLVTDRICSTLYPTDGIKQNKFVWNRKWTKNGNSAVNATILILIQNDNIFDTRSSDNIIWMY